MSNVKFNLPDEMIQSIARLGRPTMNCQVKNDN